MMKTARTMTCSICHDSGHNKRTCIRRNCRDIIEDIISSAVDIADENKMTDEEWVDQYDSPNVRPYKSCTQCSERKSCGSYDADCNWLCEDCYADYEEECTEQSPEEINAHLREYIQKQRKKLDDMEEEIAEKDEIIQKLQTALDDVVKHLQTALHEQEAKESKYEEEEEEEEEEEDEEAMEKAKEKRIDKVWEFMEWQMNMIIDYKSGKITHAQGMRMMRDLYPEFTPDDKEGEDSFTDKEWEQKHDWDNLDFGTVEEPQCGLCGCSSDNGMWNEDGDMMEDVICDECDKRWCFDSDRDAYVLRGEPKKPLDMSAILENARKIPLWK